MSLLRRTSVTRRPQPKGLLRRVYEPQPEQVSVLLKVAHGLILEKKYTEARQILLTLDHPTARQWLARIDQITARQPAPAAEAAPSEATASAAEAEPPNEATTFLLDCAIAFVLLFVGSAISLPATFLLFRHLLSHAMQYASPGNYTFNGIDYSRLVTADLNIQQGIALSLGLGLLIGLLMTLAIVAANSVIWWMGKSWQGKGRYFAFNRFFLYFDSVVYVVGNVLMVILVILYGQLMRVLSGSGSSLPMTYSLYETPNAYDAPPSPNVLGQLGADWAFYLAAMLALFILLGLFALLRIGFLMRYHQVGLGKAIVLFMAWVIVLRIAMRVAGILVQPVVNLVLMDYLRMN